MCMGRHFFLLAQRQMYDNQIDAAMKTAIRCKDFEDVLDPVDLHSLIALIACHNKFFNICSQAPACLHACTPARLHTCTRTNVSHGWQAFIKLESPQDGLSADKREAYANLALQIFTKYGCPRP